MYVVMEKILPRFYSKILTFLLLHGRRLKLYETTIDGGVAHR
jgi:hypothetical protein